MLGERGSLATNFLKKFFINLAEPGLLYIYIYIYKIVFMYICMYFGCAGSLLLHRLFLVVESGGCSSLPCTDFS